MAIRRETVTVTGATGGAGVATNSAKSSHPINGIILAIHLAGSDSPPNTTDVTIVEAHNSPAMPILTVTNFSADGWYQPLAQAEDTAGATFTGAGVGVPVDDYISLTIAQANNGDGMTATIYYVEG